MKHLIDIMELTTEEIDEMIEDGDPYNRVSRGIL